jgi:acyl dehydratase
VERYSVVAHNSATASTNKIHDDAVARRYGFAGGLVPGVDVYAYLTHAPAAAWGLDWLAHGAIDARFVQPVYEGDTVEVVPDSDGGLELRDGQRQMCAAGHAAVSAGATPPMPDVAEWPDVDQRADPPPAAPETLVPGTTFGIQPHGFRADRAGEYLAEVRETLPLYIDEGVAHPGWLLRDANYVLSANVRLGPWIHVESRVQHFGLVHDGDVVSARALVTDEWERKGHRFVALDVLHLAGDRPVARTAHTAIYRPRGAG